MKRDRPLFAHQHRSPHSRFAQTRVYAQHHSCLNWHIRGRRDGGRFGVIQAITVSQIVLVPFQPPGFLQNIPLGLGDITPRVAGPGGLNAGHVTLMRYLVRLLLFRRSRAGVKDPRNLGTVAFNPHR